MIRQSKTRNRSAAGFLRDIAPAQVDFWLGSQTFLKGLATSYVIICDNRHFPNLLSWHKNCFFSKDLIHRQLQMSIDLNFPQGKGCFPYNVLATWRKLTISATWLVSESLFCFCFVPLSLQEKILQKVQLTRSWKYQNFFVIAVNFRKFYYFSRTPLELTPSIKNKILNK